MRLCIAAGILQRLMVVSTHSLTDAWAFLGAVLLAILASLASRRDLAPLAARIIAALALVGLVGVAAGLAYAPDGAALQFVVVASTAIAGSGFALIFRGSGAPGPNVMEVEPLKKKCLNRVMPLTQAEPRLFSR